MLGNLYLGAKEQVQVYLARLRDFDNFIKNS
jgi:hypothetical protein